MPRSHVDTVNVSRGGHPRNLKLLEHHHPSNLFQIRNRKSLSTLKARISHCEKRSSSLTLLPSPGLMGQHSHSKQIRPSWVSSPKPKSRQSAPSVPSQSLAMIQTSQVGRVRRIYSSIDLSWLPSNANSTTIPNLNRGSEVDGSKVQREVLTSKKRLSVVKADSTSGSATILCTANKNGNQTASTYSKELESSIDTTSRDSVGSEGQLQASIVTAYRSGPRPLDSPKLFQLSKPTTLPMPILKARLSHKTSTAASRVAQDTFDLHDKLGNSVMERIEDEGVELHDIPLSPRPASRPRLNPPSSTDQMLNVSSEYEVLQSPRLRQESMQDEQGYEPPRPLRDSIIPVDVESISSYHSSSQSTEASVSAVSGSSWAIAPIIMTAGENDSHQSYPSLSQIGQDGGDERLPAQTVFVLEQGTQNKNLPSLPQNCLADSKASTKPRSSHQSLAVQDIQQLTSSHRKAIKVEQTSFSAPSTPSTMSHNDVIPRRPPRVDNFLMDFSSLSSSPSRDTTPNGVPTTPNTATFYSRRNHSGMSLASPNYTEHGGSPGMSRDSSNNKWDGHSSPYNRRLDLEWSSNKQRSPSRKGLMGLFTKKNSIQLLDPTYSRLANERNDRKNKKASHSGNDSTDENSCIETSSRSSIIPALQPQSRQDGSFAFHRRRISSLSMLSKLNVNLTSKSDQASINTSNGQSVDIQTPQSATSINRPPSSYSGRPKYPPSTSQTRTKTIRRDSVGSTSSSMMSVNSVGESVRIMSSRFGFRRRLSSSSTLIANNAGHRNGSDVQRGESIHHDGPASAMDLMESLPGRRGTTKVNLEPTHPTPSITKSSNQTTREDRAAYTGVQPILRKRGSLATLSSFFTARKV